MPATEIMLAEPEQTTLALEIPAGQTFAEWIRMGRRLRAASEVIQWHIGDWWNAGKAKYGEREAKAAAAEIWGVEAESARVFGWVASKFPPVTRVTALPFRHHQEVASLPHEAAISLLGKAERDGLSKRELKREILRHRIAAGEFTPPVRDDPEHDELLAIARAWNRARIAVRQEFADLVAEAGTEEIDP